MKKFSKEAFFRRADVSRNTVLQYLADPFSVKPTTRARIEKTMREFGGLSAQDLRVDPNRAPKKARSNRDSQTEKA